MITLLENNGQEDTVSGQKIIILQLLSFVLKMYLPNSEFGFELHLFCKKKTECIQYGDLKYLTFPDFVQNHLKSVGVANNRSAFSMKMKMATVM